MKSTKCHICGHVNETPDGSPSFCVRCGADLADAKIETKLMEDTISASYATSDKMSDIRKEAFIYLTDKRLIVIPADVQFQGYNLTGVLTAKAAKAFWNKITSGQPGLISIPFESVKSVRDGKFGLLVKALIVEITDGEIVKITVSKRNEWKEIITKSAINLR